MPDFKFPNNDIEVLGGDLRLLTDSIVQEAIFRFETPKGSHWYYEGYGTELEDAIGEKNTPSIQVFILSCLEDGLAQDPRIPENSCKVDIYAQEQDVYCDIKINGQPATYVLKI